MAKGNFECMICDYKGKIKDKGYHLGVCKECVRRIKTAWPDNKDIPVISDDKPV